jgi:hypothetical protein
MYILMTPSKHSFSDGTTPPYPRSASPGNVSNASASTYERRPHAMAGI